MTRRHLAAGGEYTMEKVRAGSPHYFRGLAHLERYLAGAGDLSAEQRLEDEQLAQRFRNTSNGWAPAGNPEPDAVKAMQDCRERERQVLVRIARDRIAKGLGDEAVFMNWAVSEMPEDKKFAVLYDVIRDTHRLPDAGRRTYRLATHGYVPAVLDTDAGRRFLDKLEQIPGDDVRDAVAALRRDAAASGAEARAAWAANQAAQAAAQAASAAPVERPPPEAGGGGVRFEPVELAVDGRQAAAAAELRIVGCAPAGDGVDVLLTQGGLLVMKQKGRAKSLWKTDELNLWWRSAGYDGRYVWAAGARLQKRPVLLVVDPVAERVWELTAADGLPLADPAGLPEFAGQTLDVAALAPGRACVAGAFGRTWLANVTFDAPAGDAGGKPAVGVKVFHEAREAADPTDRRQWTDPAVAFTPTVMRTLTDAPTGQGNGRQQPQPRRRVLIGRQCDNYEVMTHPLLVDPDTGTVEPVADVFRYDPPNGQTIGLSGGAAYTIDGGPDGRMRLYRLGFPELSKAQVRDDVPEGWVVFENGDGAAGGGGNGDGGRMHVLGKKWWAGTPESGVVPLTDTVPWHYTNRFVAPGTQPDVIGPLPKGASLLAGVFHSRHYGLLVLTHGEGTSALLRPVFKAQPR